MHDLFVFIRLQIITKSRVVKEKIKQHLNVFVFVGLWWTTIPYSVTGLRTHCTDKKGNGRREKKMELLSQIVLQHCLIYGREG